MRFQRALANLLSITIIFAIGVLPVMGVSTSIWEQKTQKDFEAGKPKNVSIFSKGEVSLSLKLKSYVETEESYIWSLVEDSKGNIYAGTGNNGRIFKIAPDGTSSLFFDSPEQNIHSLAVDKNDNIYAGTSPDGLIYKITPDGMPNTLLSSKEKYVWALVFDDAGNLYAGTGTGGKIYKITPDGQNSVLYDSEETHIMSLTYSNNALYAGSEGGGIIYKITSDGHASVVYDTDEKEIHVLAIDSQGNLYAAATSGKVPSQEEGRQGGGLPPPVGVGAPKEKQSSIYQVTPEGVVSEFWRAKDPLILSMVVDKDNNLVVGTGNKGIIYNVMPDGESSSMVKCDEAQVLAIHKTASGGMFIATGNNGKIYQLSTDYVEEGTLESQAYDANIISKWGNIQWKQVTPQGTAIKLVTRTGNTSKPDNTWSEWSEEYTTPNGQKITNPSARFIQWRAKLTTTNSTITPVLKRVLVAYVQENIAPKIKTITIDSQTNEQQEKGPQPGGPQRPGRRPTSAQPSAVGSKRTVKWQVSDANKDSMEYTIYYKGVDEQTWKLLKKELKNTSYSWDSTSMPDGRYQIKLVANDKLSNPANLTKTAEKISEPFEIDNTQPTISEITVSAAADGTFQVKCVAEDKMNRIKEAVFSIDGQKWQLVFPSDGIFDAKTEEFAFAIPADLKPGEHTVVIKVTDAADNVSSGKQVFTK